MTDSEFRTAYAGFNSKLVRLKDITEYRLLTPYQFQFQTGAIKSRLACAAVPRPRYFNSKLVRLKGNRRALRHSRREFQFQTGAIKRRRPLNLEAFLKPYFNSKLVRLKGTRFSGRVLNARGCFNSKLVRLKDAAGSAVSTFIASFNSKLVRLKVEHDLHHNLLHLVSIPNWCD